VNPSTPSHSTPAGSGTRIILRKQKESTNNLASKSGVAGDTDQSANPTQQPALNEDLNI
jgi:hypothetical protein